MGRCREKSEFGGKDSAATLAKGLAPEEIRRGDFVTPLYVVHEWPSWFWCADDALHPREEPVRMRFTPSDEAMPLKVTDVCLPFVLVRTPHREKRTLDVRRYRLARLDRSFARRAARAFRKQLQRPPAKR